MEPQTRKHAGSGRTAAAGNWIDLDPERDEQEERRAIQEWAGLPVEPIDEPDEEEPDDMPF